MPTADLPGDLSMYYEDDDFTDPWARPDTVILHHGNAKNARLWYAWVPLLARDFRVIRLDARGFGRSSVPAPGYPWSLDEHAGSRPEPHRAVAAWTAGGGAGRERLRPAFRAGPVRGDLARLR